MFYSIRHLTKFRYSSAVSESLMEVRMNPRSEGVQRCLSFSLSVTPLARVQHYRDYWGNVIHHFDVPSLHRHLTIIAEATVDVTPQTDLPERLAADAWSHLDAEVADRDFWEMLTPSHFAQWTNAIAAFAAELKLPPREEARRTDPLTLLLGLNSAVNRAIEYVPKSTCVDSAADDALRNRQGVCQDYSHIMIALVRQLGIPCRYVSGYLFHRAGVKTRPRKARTMHGSSSTVCGLRSVQEFRFSRPDFRSRGQGLSGMWRRPATRAALMLNLRPIRIWWKACHYAVF